MTSLLLIVGLPVAVVAGATVIAARWRRQARTVAWNAPVDDPAPLPEVASWFEALRAESPDADWVADATWRDLDGDALFRAVDRTRTPLGRQSLYRALRSPFDATEHGLVQAIAAACGAHPAFRDAVRQALGDQQGSGAYRMHHLLRDRALVPQWAVAAPVLATVLLASLALAPLYPKLLIAVAPLALLGITMRISGLRLVGVYIGPLRELAPLLRTAHRLSRLFEASPVAAHLDAAQRAALREALAPAGVPLARLRRVASIVRPDFGAADDVASSLYEYGNLVLLLDLNGLLLTSRTLARHRPALQALCHAVGVVDLGHAVAAFRSTRRWCTPTVGAPDAPLRFEALQHPALPEGVTNDVCLRRGRGLLLTGANMSGKSTLLRAIGANVLLARAMATCTAARAYLPTTRVFSSIGHTDDLDRGVSYFYAEAQAVATLLRHATTGPALILLDELFRGTNAAERIAAAEAVLRRITTGGDHGGDTGGAGGAAQWVAIASHDIQLGELLADCFEVAHLEVAVHGERLDFRYRLRAGPATTRTALALLAQCGVDEALLEGARHRAAALERR